MPDETPTCKSCGAALEGRDVYEGVCRTCREEAVLGSVKPPKKPPRPQPPPPPTPSAPPAKAPPEPSRRDVIALETDVDSDADTKEMLVLERAAAERRGESPRPTAASVEPVAKAARDDTPITFLELEKPAESAPRSERAPIALEMPPVADVRLKEEPVPAARRVEQAPSPGPPQPRAAVPLAVEEPPIRIAEAEPSRPEAAPPPEPAARPEPLRVSLVVEKEEPPRAPSRPGPPSLPTGSRPEATEPVVLSLVAAEKRARPGPPPMPALPAADASPLRLEQEFNEVEIRALLVRLANEVQEVSARLRGSAGLSVTPGQQVAFGLRAFFGFALGAVLLALAGAGILGLVGLLFHPPAFALLKQILATLFGTR